MKKILFSVFVLAASLLLAFNFAGEASAKTKKSAAILLGTMEWEKSALTEKGSVIGIVLQKWVLTFRVKAQK